MSVSWQRSDLRFRIELETPSDTMARLCLPGFRGRERLVYVNRGQTRCTLVDGRQTLDLPGGRHTVEQVEPDRAVPPTKTT